MAKERKLVDEDDFYTGPMTETRENGKDPADRNAPVAPGTGQGGTDDVASGTPTGKVERPGSYGGYDY